MSNHNILEELTLCVCQEFRITKNELLTGRRDLFPRGIFFHLAKIYAHKYTILRLSNWSGINKDTVYFYIKRSDELLTYNLPYRETFNRVERKYLKKKFAPYLVGN